MNLLKTWILWSMLATAGIGTTEYPTNNIQVIEAAMQAEVIPEPVQAEVIEEEPEEETIQKAFPEEDEAVEEGYVIDDEEIESCDHQYSRTRGTGGEEGDVWEYVCDKCGLTYTEPYDGPGISEGEEYPETTEDTDTTENITEETEE